MLEEQDWDGAVAFADQLAAYTEAETLPWAEFFIDRCHVLAAWGRGNHSDKIADEIRRVQEVAAEAGITMTYPELGPS